MSESFGTQISSHEPALVQGDVLVMSEATLSLLGNKNELADLRKQLKSREFGGGFGDAVMLLAPREWGVHQVAVVGLGEDVSASQEGWRLGMGIVLKAMRANWQREVAVMLSEEEIDLGASQAVYEATALVEYVFAGYKKKLVEERLKRAIKRLQLVVDVSAISRVKKMIKESERVMAGVEMTRNLVNEPASHMSPKLLVDAAKGIARGAARVSVTVMNKAQAEKKKFSAFLAVARGSKEQPYVIHLKYKPKGKAKAKIVLVGKGITFDSGGLSLKPASYMEMMKIDMGGAATVLGVFQALRELDVPVEVHGVIATCENMPSGEAYRPGDILEAKNGKTIEVLNTDAEGRITLADALTYACELKPDAVIDLATLTGAVVVALGDTHAGLWSNDEGLQESLLAAAESANEGLVALPLPREYRQTIESKVADLRNISTLDRMGGAITAALFLEEFVADGVKWAHIDIAGPVFSERPLLSYYGYGGTGYGVRTLLKYLRQVS